MVCLGERRIESSERARVSRLCSNTTLATSSSDHWTRTSQVEDDAVPKRLTCAINGRSPAPPTRQIDISHFQLGGNLADFTTTFCRTYIHIWGPRPPHARPRARARPVAKAACPTTVSMENSVRV